MSRDDDAAGVVALYDRALPQVYGYLLRRCGTPSLAEDLTAETFLAAVDAVRRGRQPELSTAWVVGVARHKLVDHWRRQERERRTLRLTRPLEEPSDDPWEAHLDAMLAHETLQRLAPQHRAALVLRYVDGLPVADVADHLGRTLHATETLLVRARRAFRRVYEDHDPEGTT